MARSLLVAGAVLAGDPPRPTARAVLVEDGRIVWVGQDPETAPDAARASRVDLPAAVIVPGFVDAHFHLGSVVAARGAVDVRDVRTVRELARRLADGAARSPEGGWVVAWGLRELEQPLDRRITRRELDAAVGERPVLVMHSSYHSGVASSAALEAVGFGRTTPRWPGGEMERARDGEPTGRLWERAFGVVHRRAVLAFLEAVGSGWADHARDTARSVLAEGITHLGDATALPEEIERAADARLPIGITAMPVSEKGFYGTPGERVLSGPKTGEGDDRFGIGHLKLFADGAERCAMRIPLRAAGRALVRGARSRSGPPPTEAIRSYRPRFRRGAVHTGTLHYRPDELAQVVRAGREAGFRIAVHALGNEGLEQAILALDRSGARGSRLEHAMFATEAQAEDMARLAVTAVVQPGHLFSYGSLVTSTGIERDLPPVPARRFLDHGVPVAISSDAPTGIWEPLRIIRVAVERRTEDDTPLSPEQAVTREEALRGATAGGAEAAGVGDAKGVIAPGRAADLAVLSGDPFDHRTRVLQTWVAGRRVWPDAG